MEPLNGDEYTLIEKLEEESTSTVKCPEQSFQWFYKLWRVQGYFNLVITKLYPIIQTVVILMLLAFLIYIDYGKVVGYPLKTMTKEDGSLPKFSDFFKADLLKNVIFFFVFIVAFCSIVRYSYKIYKMTKDPRLIAARKFFGRKEILSYGGDWERVKSVFRFEEEKDNECEDGTVASSVLMSSVTLETAMIDDSIILETEKHEPTEMKEVKDVKNKSDANNQLDTKEAFIDDDGLHTTGGDGFVTKTEDENLFVKYCTLRSNLLSRYVIENETGMRGRSKYLYRIIQDIYFPPKDFDFYKSLSSQENPNYQRNYNCWKSRVEKRKKYYLRWHSSLFVIISATYNLLILLLRYFGMLLTPSSLTDNTWTPYAKNALRRNNSLPHETETLFGAAKEVIEGLIELTPVNQFKRACMRNLSSVVVVVFVVFFTMNMRNEFIICGVSSALVCNILLTASVMCYGLSNKKIYTKTFHEAEEEINHMFPQIRTMIGREQQQGDITKYIKSKLYVDFYEFFLRELLAPFVVNENIKNFSENEVLKEVQTKVIAESVK
ncbi:hypothetical protein EIN_047400 [Entamoeba invadens IP1]|uniref:Autophagy-related protein 9 n=1 Tax=Entamoeba invadens IP1 TaxID=370355 RepID=A0A0A1UG60_ENTIV|nr:hypothetical protein EIN_047400 [Entamoeba invadens IP1]ELP94447.1 hypothetical protein EIN_047400 [Entamoeba invadens IP1]|eukprot:XP_004261218.1 hypothetical protein EIN_047400 [Entamoeba invadens IP1]